MDVCDEGLFYIRTWVHGSTKMHEEKFTSRQEADKCMDEWSRDRAYSRVEYLEAREWMTRTIVQKTE